VSDPKTETRHDAAIRAAALGDAVIAPDTMIVGGEPLARLEAFLARFVDPGRPSSRKGFE